MGIQLTEGMNLEPNKGTGSGIWGKRSTQEPASPVETTIKVIPNELPNETRNIQLEKMRDAADKATHGKGNQKILPHDQKPQTE